jgi:hypothetical protein
MKRIITISREFGSGGRFIGKEIAEKLGIGFYDKDIIAKVSEKTGFAKEFIEEKGEYAPLKNIFAYGLVGRNMNGQSVDDMLFAAQREFIMELAEKESCVIVGRNADYILRDRDDCINVFICGNMDKKIERISRLYNKSSDEAKKMIHDVDKKRAINYKYNTEKQWGMAKNYTLSLNSSELGYDKCIDIIANLAI